MAQAGKFADKALQLLRTYPRVALNNLKDMPGAYKKNFNKRRNAGKGKTHGRGHKGMGQRMTLPPLGYEGGQIPFHIRIPCEPYYKDHEFKRQYPPFSLLQVQRLIDMGLVDLNEPIDLLTFCNTAHYDCSIEDNHYGVNLTEEGADTFQAQINIEVQHASEEVIAAVERNGGVITTRYYDPECVKAMSNVLKFLKTSTPIPKCKLPPQDAFEYYSNAKNRGYLADPEEIVKARTELAQKYGYELPEISDKSQKELLLRRKDPRQIFYGLEPGWVINMKDQCVLKPLAEEHQEYYAS
ncbi:large subunit ribosomal protein L15 [Mytilus galloprovincialis]|uniref:Large ribosomal subunit protein uL15m n=1 Tax=Mytilus galloprovincialis TaxID=29158 RepID=A0A8B6GCM0_MYTGA|nr:large subunit ribosomal protein L15 [Mytilus galloprovincialis]